jgi:protein involved in polysaccharide export with SLBB domain
MNKFLYLKLLMFLFIISIFFTRIAAQTDSVNATLYTTPITDSIQNKKIDTIIPVSTEKKEPYFTSQVLIPSVDTIIRGFAKPGEAIRISAYPDTTSFVNGFYPVDGQGRVYLPIIGKMSISSMTENEFLDTLKKIYINYLRYPNLQIRHLIRVSLLGGFIRPGLYYIDPDFSLWDAVYISGGTTREDGLKRMRWERNRALVTEDIIPYYQSGQSLTSIGFKSGDQLWTPVEAKRKWWEIVVKDVVLSYVFPLATTSASLYISYLMYKTYNNR